MEHVYTDAEGIQHDLDIFQDGDVFVIHRNGGYFLDLTFDDGIWIEVYDGPTERANEYGKLLESIRFVLPQSHSN